MKESLYTQCKLKKASSEKVAFIPTQFAVAGNELTLKEGKETGWVVVEVYATVEYATIKNQQHNSDNIWIATSGPCPRGNK